MANSNLAKIEIVTAGMSRFFRSDDVKKALEKEAEKFAMAKNVAAAKHLAGKMPYTGLYGYKMKKGTHTWMAIIRPMNRAGYAIGRKYGVKKLR